MPPRPQTRREDITETLHGVIITDPYRWLEDQESPQTRAWLEEQIAYAETELESYPGREPIRNRLAALMRVNSCTIPFWRSGHYYFSRRLRHQQQYCIYRRSSLDATDELLVDPATLSSEESTSVTLLDVSHDGSLIAYGVRLGGADEIEIRLKDLNEGADLPDSMPSARYQGVAIAKSRRRLYYSVHTPQGPRVRVHEIFTDVSVDRQIFGGALTPDKYAAVGITDDANFLVVSVYHGSAGSKIEVHIADLRHTELPRPLIDNIDARFYPSFAGSDIFLQTDWDAPNGRVFKLSADTAPNSPESWKLIVPEHPQDVLEGTHPVGGKLLLNYLRNVSSYVALHDAGGAFERDLPLPGIGSASGPFGRWESDEYFFSFSSFAEPSAIYHSRLADCEPAVWASGDAPLDGASIVVEQAHFTSRDGTQVPMFLVHSAGLQMDGNRPVYLTGYGGFSVPRTPVFSALAALWAERGGVFALPNLRGGGEFGEAWHRAGMLENKQNVFEDFYAAAEWLIAAGYTRPSRIGISGRSNGGLLVGAAITQRPELFGAAVCGYPLLDMLRYHRFLVAGYWVPEYGSAEDAAQFETLLAYSPYHHVRKGVPYPSVMFVTGDADTRVAPLHARKMAALMQDKAPQKTAVLLKYDVKSGHSEGKPLNLVIEDTADELVFLYHHLGEV